MRRPALALTLLLSLSLPAGALAGSAPEVPSPKTQPEVILTGSRGTFCTGTAIATDLILTAAHCVQPGADYKLVEVGPDRQPVLRDIATIARHPRFDLKTMLAHRATADVALLKLKSPLSVRPAPLLATRPRVVVGERFVVRGYGVSARGDGSSGGRLREATLAATGQPGNLQLRLVDPGSDGGTRPGLGACTGDSGAPVYQKTSSGSLGLYGVVSWSTAPNYESGCGGITGVTPLELYRKWVEEQAQQMGSAIGP